MTRSNGWVTEELVASGSEYYDALVADIAAAQYFVDLEAYIFDYDAVGQRILAALIEASRRGVQIRLIVDGIGSYGAIDSIVESTASSNVNLRIYHPSPWHLRAYQWALRKQRPFAQFINVVTRMNHRDHRKLCVIDGGIAWVGSFNISALHLDHHVPRWRDYGVRLTGHGVTQLADSFDHLWHNRAPRIDHSYLRQYFSTLSPLSRFVKNRYLLRLINAADQRLWICSAYFAPTGRIVRAIKRASRRGVDVRLIVPEKSDIIFFPALTATYYSDLLKRGVKVYEYQQGILHAKVMLTDTVCYLGSSNLNHRSLLHDLELDVILKSKKSIEAMENGLNNDMKNARQLTLQTMPRYQLSALMGWLPRLLRYWL